MRWAALCGGLLSAAVAPCPGMAQDSPTSLAVQEAVRLAGECGGLKLDEARMMEVVSMASVPPTNVLVDHSEDQSALAGGPPMPSPMPLPGCDDALSLYGPFGSVVAGLLAPVEQ